MIVVEPMPVHQAAVLTRGNFRPSDDSVIPHFRKVTDAIRSNGAVAIQQLYHVGQHGDADNSFHAGWSPSGLPSYHDSDGSHRMTEADIEETIDGFVQAARRCHEAGFDGVEVWAAYHSHARPVLDAVVEPARRPLGRQPGEPHADEPRGHDPHPAGMRRGFHHRSRRQ